MIQPSPAMALQFLHTLFPANAWLHFRAVPEPADKSRTPTNHWYQMTGRLFDETVEHFLDYCALERRAAFFLPAIARPNKSHKDAVERMTCICADFDRGDPAASLAAAEDYLHAKADCVVESGGVTTNGPKLHTYWLLEKPADIESVVNVREQLATMFGGDPCLKQEAQVLRIPGSIHFKSSPKLVRLIRCP